MKFGLLQKVWFALGWNQAVAFLKKQPGLPDKDLFAVADTLDSSTVTGASWLIVLDALKAAASVVDGSMTLDAGVMHVTIAVFGLALCVLRHWWGKNSARVQLKLDTFKKSMLPLIILFLFLPLAMAQESPAEVKPDATPVQASPASAVPTAVTTENQNKVTVKVNAQEVATLVKFLLAEKFDKVNNPMDFLGACGDSLRFAGVYSMGFGDKKYSGGGLASELSIFTIQAPKLEAQFDLGPALVVGFGNSAKITTAAEAGLSTKFLGPKIDSLWQRSWVGWIPLHFQGMTAFVGGGAGFGSGKPSPCGSVGIGGITWGK